MASIYILKLKNYCHFLSANVCILLFILDVDECDNADGPCYSGATCNNFPGTYNCTCAPGWEGEDCLYGKSYESTHCIKPTLKISKFERSSSPTKARSQEVKC